MQVVRKESDFLLMKRLMWSPPGLPFVTAVGSKATPQLFADLRMQNAICARRHDIWQEVIYTDNKLIQPPSLKGLKEPVAVSSTSYKKMIVAAVLKNTCTIREHY